MKLDKEQQNKVEENMGLVGKVIKDRVHGLDRNGIFTYEDLYQIGCIGLCKAAATDRGTGSFSTYAYRLIWNEICDALIAGNKRQAHEILTDEELPCPLHSEEASGSIDRLDVQSALGHAFDTAPNGIKKGIRAVLLMEAGYSSSDAGHVLGLPANSVRALASKARAYLRAQPDFCALREVELY